MKTSLTMFNRLAPKPDSGKQPLNSLKKVANTSASISPRSSILFVRPQPAAAPKLTKSVSSPELTTPSAVSSTRRR